MDFGALHQIRFSSCTKLELYGVPSRTRTGDPLLKRQMLLPTELWALMRVIRYSQTIFYFLTMIIFQTCVKGENAKSRILFSHSPNVSGVILVNSSPPLSVIDEGGRSEAVGSIHQFWWRWRESNPRPRK